MSKSKIRGSKSKENTNKNTRPFSTDEHGEGQIAVIENEELYGYQVMSTATILEVFKESITWGGSNPPA